MIAIDAGPGWKPVNTAPENKVVLTKIHDESGERNIQRLKRRGGLWWTEDGAMYVYYTPTHWKEVMPSVAGTR